MPWNDNANSGGKPDKKPGGKPSPWGAPPSGETPGRGTPGGGGGGGGDRPPPRRPAGSGGGGGKRPPSPDLGDVGRQMGDRLRDLLGADGRGPSSRTWMIAGGALVVLWAASGVYMVQSTEQAVVTLFGRYYGVNGPGVHYRAPFPIMKVEKVPVTLLQTTEFSGTSADEETLMLTGDNSIINLNFSIQWRVKSAKDYLFNVKDPRVTLRDVAESAMREVAGSTGFKDLQTGARAQAQNLAKERMQAVLDRYRAGITIQNVLIRKADPPAPVIPAFNDVNSASADAAKLVSDAQGVAATIVADAKGYAATAIGEARSETAQFDQIYAQYKAAPAVTRDRIYIETMQRVLKGSKAVVIDNKNATAPIILPSDTFRPRAAPPSAQPQERGAAR